MRSRPFFLALFLILVFVQPSWSDFSDDEKLLFEKSKILTQKGQKAEGRGELDEAVACYEDAYNTYPKNIMPLLLWGKALYRVGIYQRAFEVLDKIPIDKLPDNGKSEVFLLQGKISLAAEKLEDAAAYFSRSLKAAKTNVKARVRLAMINLLMGMSNRADELFAETESFSEIPAKDILIATMIDLSLGNLGRAFASCGEMAHFTNSRKDSGEGFLDFGWIWRSQILSFFVLLPLGLSGFLSVIFFLSIFLALTLLASRLSAPTAFWHDAAFVVLSTGFLLAAQTFARHDLFVAVMLDNFSIYDSVWIMPRLILSGTLIGLFLFAIFPSFNVLPVELRPRRYEYYGIWFFCWFLMIAVLAFQSRLDGFGLKILLIAGGMALASVSGLFMPLGRFALYKITTLIGLKGIGEVSRKDFASDSSVSFTDAKILEAKALKLMNEDDWDEVVLIARKVFASIDRKNFPKLWKAMIFSLIAREDFIEPQKQLQEFHGVFGNTNFNESGQLLESFLKSCRGDFAGALKIIRSFPEDRVKAFSPDDNALSLLILGRCDLFYKENVQAHIDLNKAFSCAQLPLLRAESLVELIELDFNMRSKDAVNKWSKHIDSIKGGKKSGSFKSTLRSIAAMAEGDSELALKLAKEACELFPRNGRAAAWYGHLLCLSGQHSEAEELLARMTPDSADANRLMTEVTGT